jgi:hypothetical protein
VNVYCFSNRDAMLLCSKIFVVPKNKENNVKRSIIHGIKTLQRTKI